MAKERGWGHLVVIKCTRTALTRAVRSVWGRRQRLGGNWKRRLLRSLRDANVVVRSHTKVWCWIIVMKRISLGAGFVRRVILGLVNWAMTLLGCGWRLCIYRGSIRKYWIRHYKYFLFGCVWITPAITGELTPLIFEQIIATFCKYLLTNLSIYV